MARPSDRLNLSVAVCGEALQSVALATLRSASDLDRAALDAAVKAYERTVQWRRDTTETARREAYGAAQVAIALALAPSMERPNVARSHWRAAVSEFGAAIVALVHAGNETRAVSVAQSAQRLAGLAKAAA